jgi:isopenicillin N synthase-like dioxygenase
MTAVFRSDDVPTGEALAALEKIPSIDLGPFFAGEPGALERTAVELRHAMEGIGFFYIVNHGVTRPVIDTAFQALKDFFALPAEEKLRIRADGGMTGYLPPKSTIYTSWKLTENKKPDINEAMMLRREVGPDHPSVVAGRRGVNKWPVALPGFRPAMLRFHETMEALGRRMLPLCARALDQPPDFFNTMFDDGHFVNRNGFYPPDEREDGQFGIAPHQDHSFFTLLPVSEVPGLEVLARSGRWIPAPAVEGAILVNTGESLTRFSNGRFPATPHRVLRPVRDRYALAFFYNPSDDTVLQPLGSCVDAVHPVKYEPTTFIAYLQQRQAQNYLHMAQKEVATGGETGPAA